MEQKQIAQILLDAINKIYGASIETDEIFLLKKDGIWYEGKISPANGFVDFEGCSIYDEDGVFFNFDNIILGHIEVKQLPFKPKINQEYFVPEVYNLSKYDVFTHMDNIQDRLFIERGLACRTPHKAIELCDKMLDAIK